MTLRFGWALLALAVATACATPAPSALPYFDSPEFTPIWPEAELPTDFHQIADFSLTDHRGETVTAEAMNGKVTVADFFFSACRSICPRLAKSMATIDDAIAEDADLLLLSYSVTPNDDTVAVLSAYAEGIGVRRGVQRAQRRLGGAADRGCADPAGRAGGLSGGGVRSRTRAPARLSALQRARRSPVAAALWPAPTRAPRPPAARGMRPRRGSGPRSPGAAPAPGRSPAAGANSG